MWVFFFLLAVLAMWSLRTRAPSAPAPGPAKATAEPGTNLIPWVHRRLHLDVLGKMMKDSLHLVPVGESLAGALSVETDDGPIPLTKSQLAQVEDHTAEQLWAAAVEALRQRPCTFKAVREGLYECRTGDGHDAARFLLIKQILELGLEGPPVAIAPNRDLLLVADGSDDAALTEMLSRAQAEFTGDEYRSLVPLVLEDETWSDWDPPEEFEAQVRDVRAQTLLKDYLELTRTGFAKTPGAHVAKTDEGLVAAWVSGTEVLLPEADRYVLLDPEEAGPLHRVVADGPLLRLLMHDALVSVGTSLWKVSADVFPSRRARLFFSTLAPERDDVVAPHELERAVAEPEGWLLTVNELDEGDEAVTAWLGDGRSASLGVEAAKVLAAKLPFEDRARFEGALELATAAECMRIDEEATEPGATGKRPDEAERQFAAAVFALLFDDLPAAKGRLDRLLELRPDEPKAWLRRAELHVRLGHPEAAAAELKRFKELSAEATAHMQVLAQAIRRALRDPNGPGAPEFEHSGDVPAGMEAHIARAAQAIEATVVPAGADAGLHDAALTRETGPRGALMPVLRPPGYRQGSLLSQKAMLASNGIVAQVATQEPMSWPLASGIEVELVYDWGKVMTPLSMASAAGNLAHELKRVAMTNLEAASLAPMELVAPGVWRADWLDGFRASRLLTPELVRALGEPGPLLALTPLYDSFIVVRADDEAALAKALDVAHESLNELHEQYAWREALTATPWILGETGWTPWQAPERHALAARFKQLSVDLEARRVRAVMSLQQFSPQPAARA